MMTYRYCPKCGMDLQGIYLAQCECGWCGYWWQMKERYFCEGKYEVIFKQKTKLFKQ